MEKKHVKFAIKLIAMIIIDIIVVLVSMFASQILIDNKIHEEAFNEYIILFAFNVFVLLLCFFVLRVYRAILKYVGVRFGIKILTTIMILTLLNACASFFSKEINVRWAIVTGLLTAVLILSEKYVIRVIHLIIKGKKEDLDDTEKQRVGIIGAGDAGAMLLREITTSKNLNMVPVCMVDDDTSKIGSSIFGVKIVGIIDKIVDIAQKYKLDKLMVAMPSVNKKRIKEIIEKCRETSCEVQLLPGMYQIIKGSILMTLMRKVEVEDLLGREPVRVNLDEIMDYISDATVMVTGGGGSIGSELCRQIAMHNPRKLIIFDIYENTTYEIEQELKRKYLGGLNLVTLIGSIRDKKKLQTVFETYKPEIVFNCAAHKHVPLMETSPNEAIKNNVFGTLNLAECADKYGVKRFVQISTDKAVNPTNIMGASKRICEMIIQSMAKKSKTEFVAVRFGNVLGSNGSVIPLFKRQIEEGGPVTVTHKDIIRYFMTIPEAVSLVLQAGAYAKGGEIFVLDMGEPVRIYDLAYNLIKLSGYEPNVDIDIKITGLRPGEKLYEERLMDEEGLLKTENGLISIAKPLDINYEVFFEELNELEKAAKSETDKMKEIVQKIVPTYKRS